MGLPPTQVARRKSRWVRWCRDQDRRRGDRHRPHSVIGPLDARVAPPRMDTASESQRPRQSQEFNRSARTQVPHGVTPSDGELTRPSLHHRAAAARDGWFVSSSPPRFFCRPSRGVHRRRILPSRSSAPASLRSSYRGCRGSRDLRVLEPRNNRSTYCWSDRLLLKVRLERKIDLHQLLTTGTQERKLSPQQVVWTEERPVIHRI